MLNEFLFIVVLNCVLIFVVRLFLLVSLWKFFSDSFVFVVMLFKFSCDYFFVVVRFRVVWMFFLMILF